MKIQDITGQRFGRWVIVKLSEKRGRNGQIYWDCRCDCGRQKAVMAGSLRTGGSVSCGCYQSESLRKRLTTHGASNTPEYTAWGHMKARCTDVNSPSYPDYGGRGITVCAEWNSFSQFFADMGLRPSARHSLERKNNEMGYFPKNCKWATPPEQCNNKRDNRRLRFNGRVLTMSQWAIETGISCTNIWNRLADGWTTAEALTIPISKDKTGWEVRRLRQSRV